MAPSPVKKSKQQVESEAAKAANAAATAASVQTNGATSDDEDDQEEDKTETLKSKADESNAMEKLTDVVEEKQMDEDKMKQAFQALRKQEEADKEAERKREKQLAAVKVKKEDVELIAREMEMTTQVAERKLREADGDVVQCLTALVA